MSDRDEPDEEGEEEEETPEAAPPPPKRKLGRPARLGAAPGIKFDRQGVNEADLIWNQLVEWLPSTQDPALPTKSPYDIMVTVRRTHPPHPSGEAQPVGKGFSGSAVAGSPNELPGNALINFVMRYYHLPATDQPASYDIHFWKKGTGGQITTGRMPMPSGPECRALLRAGEQMPTESGGPGLGWPSQQPPQQPQLQQAPPGWPPPPPWYGAPPGYGAPPAPAVDQSTMQELSFLRGALGEALNAAREGRQPNIPPAPVAMAAPPPGDMEDRIVAKVLMALRGAGVATPAAPPPTAAAQQTVGGLTGMVERMVGGILETSIKTALGAVEKNIKAGMGMGAPPDEEPADATPESPEKAEDLVPWKIAAVGANWGNGSPVQVAFDKETGDISPMGLAFANPAPAEKVMDVLNGIGNAVQEAIKNFAARPRAMPPTKQMGAGFPPEPPLPPPPAPPPEQTQGGWGPPAA